MMVIEMEKLGKVHYLKHYLGGSAMVLDEHINRVGQIENIEIEDGSVLIKSGEQSHWIDGDKVTPALKSFSRINDEDIRIIIDHLSFSGTKLHSEELISWSNDCFGIHIQMTYERTIWITDNWSIIGLNNIGKTPDNIGIIIFLLCELGYDVTGHFKK